MADEESDKVRKTARESLNTVTSSGKVYCVCTCMYCM